MSEIENSLEANAETQLAAVPMPRLGISHLMLWTLCYAVYLAVIPAAYAMFGFQTDPDVLGGIVKGAVFAGVITLISTWVRGKPPLLKQPGQLWLNRKRNIALPELEAAREAFEFAIQKFELIKQQCVLK